MRTIRRWCILSSAKIPDRHHQRLCSEAGVLSGRLCRARYCRLARLAPIVQIELVRGVIVEAFPLSDFF
jgi:hypothetical protein